MRKNSRLSLVILMVLSSCTINSTYDGLDTSGNRTTLQLFDKLPDSAEKLGIVPCSEARAVGRFSFFYVGSPAHPGSLTFCFAEEDEDGYRPSAQLSRINDQVTICLPRDDGFCDDDGCLEIVYHDVCSLFELH